MTLKTNSKDVPDNIHEHDFDIDFYTGYPANARAVFSTDDGRIAFRKANVDSLMLGQIRELWSRKKIEAECKRLRRKHTYHAKTLQKPQTPVDLFKYFDAHEIYEKGPQNVLNIIDTLCVENQILDKHLILDYDVVINKWINKWLGRKNPLASKNTLSPENTLSLEDILASKNGQKLMSWSPAHGPVTSVFSLSDWDHMRDIPEDAVAAVERNLETRWRNLQESFHYWQLQVGWHVFDHYAALAASNPPAQYAFDNRYYYPPLPQFEQPYHPWVRDPSAVEALQRTSAAAMPNWAPTDQPRPTSPVQNQDKKPQEAHEHKELVNGGNQQATTSLTNAAPLHLSVNTDNNVEPAKVAQTQASPSPLPQKHRFVQHGTTDGKTPLTQHQPPVLNGPRSNDAKKPARVELPPNPKLVKHCAASAYVNGSSMKRDGNHAFGGAFQAQLSHQMPKVAPGCGASPDVTTPAFRDGRASQGGYKNKGRRDLAAGYPPQAGKEAFYSQNTHVVDTTRTWQRNASQNCNPYCRNKNCEMYEYYDCSCTECGEKNRSIWLRVTSHHREHPEEIKSRIKSGLKVRFGNVEAVNPTFCKAGNAYIVRFEDESSVAKSLKCPSLALREKDLSLSISSVFRSKWTIKAGAQNANEGSLRNQQWRPYQNATHSPISSGMRPAQTCNLAGHNARGPHQLRPVYGMRMPHIPHDLARRVCSMDYYQQGDQARAFAPICPQPSVVLQQQPAQSAQGLPVPIQEAGKAIPRPQRPEKKESIGAKEATKSFECKAQSKPPSEEAFPNDNPLETDGAVTPTAQGSPSSQMSSRKVKVSFPPVSPSRPTQSKAHEIAKPTKESGKSPVDKEAPSKVKSACKDVVVQSQSSHISQVSLEASASATTTAVTGTTACFESLPSDSTCHVPEPAQHSPAAETMSVKSAESKTLSASSSSGNRSPPRNPTKTTLAGKTSGSHSRHQSQVSKTIGSPINKNTEANNQKLNSQAENAAERGFRFPTSTDQGSFKFPDNGRGTIRAKKAEKRATVCHEGSSGQGRDTASMKRGQKNPLASQSIDLNHQNQQQANLPRGEVVQATDSAAGNDTSASATSHSRQESNTSPASDGEINKDSLRDASGSGDSGGESGWRKVWRRGTTSKKKNALGSSDGPAKKPDMRAGGADAASKTAVTPANDYKSPYKLGVSEPSTTPKARDASSECPSEGKGDNAPSQSECVANKDPEAGEKMVALAARNPDTTAQALGQGEAAAVRPQQDVSGAPASIKQEASSTGSEESPAAKTVCYAQSLNSQDWPPLSASPKRTPKR